MKDLEFVAVSGGFDPVHWGHVKMIADAARYAPVMVILNSDSWLMRKKGYVFMPWKERAYILGNIKGVSVVSAVDDSDGTVCDAIKRHVPTYFANGGDRGRSNTPEQSVCEELDVKLLWGIGGEEKIDSSSDLAKKARDFEVPPQRSTPIVSER